MSCADAGRRPGEGRSDAVGPALLAQAQLLARDVLRGARRRAGLPRDAQADGALQPLRLAHAAQLPPGRPR
eukprot:1249874-Rhodomonas_salina.1